MVLAIFFTGQKKLRMLKFILKRLLQAAGVLAIVITATFALVRLAPGGPFDSEKAVSMVVLESLREHYHLDKPLYQQFGYYVEGLVQGDFGPSFRYPGRSVTELMASGLPVTFELGFYAMLIALLLGLTAGLLAAIKPNSLLDYIPMSFSLMGICIPAFLLGPLAALFFGIYLEWLPVSGWDGPEYKILPALTLGFAYAAYIARLCRGGMLEILSQDFIRTARAKGVPEWRVILQHALRGGILPVISFLGPAFAGLLSGSFVVESIFQIPGMGRFYVQAAFNRDYTMVMGTTILFAFLVVIFNLVTDIISFGLNPRQRGASVSRS